MIPRDIASVLKKYSRWFPVVSVTGPRQSGKSTLVQEVFSDYSYVNLELPGERAAANADPLGYIHSHPAPLIIDEAQLAPELFNVLSRLNQIKWEPQDSSSFPVRRTSS